MESLIPQAHEITTDFSSDVLQLGILKHECAILADVSIARGTATCRQAGCGNRTWY